MLTPGKQRDFKKIPLQIQGLFYSVRTKKNKV